MPVRCAGKTAHVFGSRKKEDICVLASQGIQVCTVKPGQTTNSSHYLSALSWEGSWLSYSGPQGSLHKKGQLHVKHCTLYK